MEPNPIFQLEAAIPNVLDTRYLSVAGLTVLLWDHCLTFEKEKQLIWPSRVSFNKWAFLSNRYIVPVALGIEAYISSFEWDKPVGTIRSVVRYQFNASSLTLYIDGRSCRTWLMIIGLLGIISVATSNFLILSKIWILWDRERSVIVATSVGFIGTQAGSAIIMAISVRQMSPSIKFTPALKMCTLTEKPDILKGLWVLTITFELLVFSMVCLNAVTKPRLSDVLLVKVLYRDGICFFLSITALRVLNLVVAIIAPASQIFLGVYCVWALVTTVVSRMIMNLREAELKMDAIGVELEHSAI